MNIDLEIKQPLGEDFMPDENICENSCENPEDNHEERFEPNQNDMIEENETMEEE